ncbi:hypothetical protein ID866_13253, partial [Astraeus odoratus]
MTPTPKRSGTPRGRGEQLCTGRRMSAYKRASQLASKPAAPAPVAKDEPPLPESPPMEMQFIPKLKGAAEMEARRRLHIMARRGQHTSVQKPPSVTSGNLNHELSSSEEKEDTSSSSEDNGEDFDANQVGDDIMDGRDEFDLDLAATRTYGVDSPSDVASLVCGTASASVSQPSPLISASYIAVSQPILDMPLADMSFARRLVPPPRPRVSALSAILASSGGSSNPFSE